MTGETRFLEYMVHTLRWHASHSVWLGCTTSPNYHACSTAAVGGEDDEDDEGGDDDDAGASSGVGSAAQQVYACLVETQAMVGRLSTAGLMPFNAKPLLRRLSVVATVLHGAIADRKRATEATAAHSNSERLMNTD